MCWQADEMLCDKVAAGRHAGGFTCAHKQVGAYIVNIVCCIGKENVRLMGQTIRFTVIWVDHSLLRALRNIISHGSVEVSAEKDKEFYTNKLQTVHVVDLPVCANRCCCC